MQFITNGPDIPDALLQVHEEGRVVFFCGAGISYPAGLPGFEGLVRGVMQRTGDPPDANEDGRMRGQPLQHVLEVRVGAGSNLAAADTSTASLPAPSSSPARCR